MKHFNVLYLTCFILQTILWSKIGNVEGIVGGTPATHGQFQYMVSVQADGEHVCGGAIVSNLHIVTAAHCVIGEDNKFRNKKFTILGGATNLMLDKVEPIEVEVQGIYAPKDFVPIKRDGINYYPEEADIAILRLKTELPLNSRLSALQLPQRDQNNNLQRYSNQVAILTGYGIETDPEKTDPIKVGPSSIKSYRLNFVEATVQHKNSCKLKLSFLTHERYIIAAVSKHRVDDHAGACNGDTGSPLVYNGALIGVLAQHRDCCNEFTIGSVYTRVTYYLKYVKDAINGIRGRNGRFATYKEGRSALGQIIWNLEEI